MNVDDLFDCPNLPGALRLLPHSCAASWELAQESTVDRLDPRFPCRSCAIGARHAGKPHKPARTHSKVDTICPRCTNPRNRYVMGVCISCYNRERELIRGVNARGKAPTKLRAVLPVRVAYIEAGRRHEDTLQCWDRLEADLREIRTHEAPILLTRTAPIVPGQMSLFMGAS